MTLKGDTGMSLAEKLKPFDSELPLERAHTIPSAWYFDEEIYWAECCRVFGGSWQTAGRVEQVSEPGSFLTTNIAGEPILVVRDDKGTLRAFHNVCRHRAAQVINEPCGKASKLRCRYHGWTYDLAGKLRGTPEFDGVLDFPKEGNGLVPLAVDTWGPLVFVHAGTSKQTLADFLAPFPQRTTGLGLDRLRFAGSREYVLECNWKVFVDNYQDGGYHVNTVHPGLAGAIDYAHYRTEILGNTSVQISPLKPAEDAAVGKVRTGDNAYYWWIFPNLMVNIYQGVMDTNLVLPLGPNRCRVIFDFYFAQTEGAEAQQYIDESIAVAHQIQMEDQGVCEEVQRGLKSRSYDTGRFSVKREGGGYHFHRLLAQKLRSAEPAA
jgi:phenylpropionate dioxygenase-like ring-hydroxylating dioxygenase large terminal subunit